MCILPKVEPGRDLAAEADDVYDRLTRGIAAGLDVYSAAAADRRAVDDDLPYFDLPAGPPSRIEVDAALGFAVELLRGSGDEPTAWLIVEAMALRGGPPRKVLDAIVALRTLHKGGSPPLVETARKAAGGPPGVDLAAWLGRRDGRTPARIVRPLGPPPTIEPMGDGVPVGSGPKWLIRKGDRVVRPAYPEIVMEVMELDLAGEPQRAFCHANGPDLYVDRWFLLDTLVRVHGPEGGDS